MPTHTPHPPTLPARLSMDVASAGRSLNCRYHNIKTHNSPVSARPHFLPARLSFPIILSYSDIIIIIVSYFIFHIFFHFILSFRV